MHYYKENTKSCCKTEIKISVLQQLSRKEGVKITNNNLNEDFPYGVIITTKNMIITFINKEGKSILNTNSNIIGKNLYFQLQVHNFDLINKNGSIIQYRKNKSVYTLLKKTKNNLFYFLLIKTDKLFEFEKIKNKNHSLKQDLQALMTLSGELVSIIDNKGKFINVNDAYLELMNLKENEVIGKSVYNFQSEGMYNISSAATALREEKINTITQTTKNGKRLIVRSYPIINKEGEVERIINIAKDITEKENLLESLKETRNLVNYYQSELTRATSEVKRKFVKSKSLEDIYELIYRVSDSEATVLLLGESGTGKSVLAEEIHSFSSRKNSPFVHINCGAIPESLIESELFGYAKGTFTGALQEGKRGLIAAADKGTLFLDEIGELPLNLQVKILQVLQEKKVTPLGEVKPQKIDVRFIAATNMDLKDMVNKGSFRKDLYYRLNVVPILIPPLRKRKEEIPFFVDFFLREFNKKYNQFKTIDVDVMEKLTNHYWEGNIRELQNTIERLVITIPGDCIQLKHLSGELVNNDILKYKKGSTLKETMEEFEKSILHTTLQSSRTMKEASEKLGINISTVSRKAKKYNLNFTHFNKY